MGEAKRAKKRGEMADLASAGEPRKTSGTWRFKLTFLGWLSDPFKGLSDLQLGDEKGTLNHLVVILDVKVSFFWWV